MSINIGDLLYGSRKNGHRTNDPIVRMLVRVKYNDICAICNRVYNSRINNAHYFNRIQIDHIIPYSHGGVNHISNYQLTCAECNIKKSDTIPDY